MEINTPIVNTAEPASFGSVELDDFVSFVLAGGEVTGKGLRNRVLNAQCISFMRERNCLIGVGGLKRPSANHRSDVEIGAGVKLDAGAFPFELGWVFILPIARGRKLSQLLCESLVAGAGNKGIFATSQEKNKGMHVTLKRIGFVCVGKPWPSIENSGRLLLFARNTI